MKGSTMSLEQAIQEIVHELPPHKQRDLLAYASRLQAEGAKKPPFRSIEGLRAHLGISLSAEEIDENQREMWRNSSVATCVELNATGFVKSTG